MIVPERCPLCDRILTHMNRNFYICECNVIYQYVKGELIEYHTLGEDISDDVCIIDEITNCKG